MKTTVLLSEIINSDNDGKITGAQAIRAVWNSSAPEEEKDILATMAEFLGDNNWHVAENATDLRDIALKETDLLEPEEA